MESKRVITVLDFDRFALEQALRMPVAKLSTQSMPLNPDYVDDPQIVELNGQQYVAKKFQYVANFAFAGNGTLGQTIQIDSDADFQLLFLLGSRDSNAVTVNVTEGGAGGLAWMSAPVNIDNFIGTAQLPFPAGLIPQLLPKKRVYNISCVNSSGATNNVQIIFEGYKLFPAAMAAQVGAQPSSH